MQANCDISRSQIGVLAEGTLLNARYVPVSHSRPN